MRSFGIAIDGIGVTANEAYLAEMLATTGPGTIEAIKRAVTTSPYWPAFCEAELAGEIPDDWLPAPLGVVVRGWARAAERG